MSAAGPANVRRVVGLWGWVAFAGIPLVLVMGVWQLARASSSSSPSSVAVETVFPAGEPFPVTGGTDGWTVWGQPVGVDLSAVTCTVTTPTGPGTLEVDRGASSVTDSLGHGELVLLTTTADAWTAQTATCAGGGLTGVARTAAPTPGADRAFGLVLLVMAPVLLGLGLLARRAGRVAR